MKISLILILVIANVSIHLILKFLIVVINWKVSFSNGLLEGIVEGAKDLGKGAFNYLTGGGGGDGEEGSASNKSEIEPNPACAVEITVSFIDYKM